MGLFCSSMKDFSWFRSSLPRDTKEKTIECIDYYNLAKDRVKVQSLILKDPSILFRVVGEEANCMCGGTCGNCEFDDITFFELVIREKSVTEDDLLQVAKQVDIDWFKISSHVPLSNEALALYKDKVDWKSVSSSWMYKKDAEFVERFWEYMDWSKTNCVDLDEKQVESLVFQRKLVPISFAISKKLLTDMHVKEYLSLVLQECNGLLKHYGSKFVESLDDETGMIKDKVLQCANKFTDSCIAMRYTPKKYGHVVKFCLDKAGKHGLHTWWDFLNSCRPNEAFIETYVVDSADAETWSFLSKGKIPLSDGFVSKYFELLNLHELLLWKQFDVKQLPLEKIQLSVLCKYQKLTPEFVESSLLM